MASYRLYGLDGDRSVASGEWFDADDDHGAIEVATKRFYGRPCEIWQGPRLVVRLSGKDHGERRRDAPLTQVSSPGRTKGL